MLKYTLCCLCIALLAYHGIQIVFYSNAPAACMTSERIACGFLYRYFSMSLTKTEKAFVYAVVFVKLRMK